MLSLTIIMKKFAKIFNEKLVANVNEFYIKSKLKTGINLNVLQKESDSVRNVLNNSIQILAALDESIPKLNPLLKTLKTPYQKAMADVQANTAIFQELVKQLELAKVFGYRNSTPLIQIIDRLFIHLKVQNGNFQKPCFMVLF